MRYRVLTIVTLLALFFGLAANANAQPRPAVELRGGLNMPVGDFGDSDGLDADALVGLGADVIIPVSPRFSVYAGGGTEMFDCAGCEGDDGLSTLGLEAGGKFFLVPEDRRVLPWIKAGATYERLSFTFEGAEGDSDWGLGFQAAFGADIPLGQVLSFSPAVRYQMSTAEWEPLGLEFINAETKVRYLSLDLGLHIHLGS